MRMIGTLTVAALVVAFAVQTAVLVKTRSRLGDLEAKLLSAGGDGSSSAQGDDGDQAAEPSMGSRRDGRRPPPEFVAAMEALGAAAAAPTTASNEPLPLPPALSTPEAREQLKNYIGAVMNQQREEERDRARQQRDQIDKRNRERAAEQLGLNSQEAQKFDQILAGMNQARQDLFGRIQSGQLSRADVGQQMGELRQKTDAELKQVLGDDRFAKYQDVQRDLGLGTGRGGGWRGGMGGPPGTAPTPGGPAVEAR